MDLFTSVYAFQGLSPQNLIEIASAHTPLNFRKGQYFLRENEQMDGYYILAEGLVRTFVHDISGNDITTDFVSPGQLIIDVVSLFQRVPSRENIVAITDGKAYKLSFERFQEFFHQVEAFREWGRSWMVDTIVRQRKRNIAMITATATQRYISLQQEQPEIIQQATLKNIASYLGVTDTSLSRIRSELASPHFPS